MDRSDQAFWMTAFGSVCLALGFSISFGAEFPVPKIGLLLIGFMAWAIGITVMVECHVREIVKGD